MLSLVDWHATNLSASDGAVALLSYANAFTDAFDGLDIVTSRFRVQGARAAQSGGVLAIHSGRPYQIPWRTRDPTVCSFPGISCTEPLYNSTMAPLVYAVQVRAWDWDIANVAETTGALVAMNYANASFSNVHAQQVTAASSGGLWSLTGYTLLFVRNLAATIDRASAGARGLLLDQSQSPGNLSLSNVSAQLEDGPVFNHGTQAWIHAGALTQTPLSETSIRCPTGGTLYNASHGRVQLTESPFSTVERVASASGVVNRVLSTAQAFLYLSTTLGCSMCPEGKYVFASLAWVSPDVHGAVCTPGFDANASFPLCHNAPMDKARCIDCPTGAVCHGGANVTAQVGRWGTTSQGDADTLISVFPLLQFGYACSSPSCQQRYDSCAGNRTGFACGRCRRGFGEALGSPECIADSECRDWAHYTAWAVFPVGCIAAAALFLHSASSKSDGVTSGLTTILFVLFQSEAIIRITDGSNASTLSRIAMFDPTLPGARVCLWPEMSARAKALIPLGSYCGILAVLALFYSVHCSLFWRLWTKHSPCIQRYKRALVSLFLVSYSAVASVCLRLITPTVVDGVWYQSLTGERWMATADQWIALMWLVSSTVPTPFWFWYGLGHLREGTISDVRFGLGLLFPIPAALWPRQLKWRHMTSVEAKAARDLYQALAAPYGGRFWYWSGVFLAQRLVLGLISVLLASDLLYRACASAAFTVALALTYTHLRVFAASVVNIVHTVALAGLLAVCFSNAMSANTHQLGFLARDGQLAVHRVASWVLWGVPVVAIAARLSQYRSRATKKSRRHHRLWVQMPSAHSNTEEDES